MKRLGYVILGIILLLGVAWWLQRPPAIPETAPKEQAGAESKAPTTINNELEKTVRKTYTASPDVLPEEERAGKSARITTLKGEITFTIFGEEVPKTASNFITLTNDGFYNGTTFHRREEGFVIQGGDPDGTGGGGPGYTFEDESVSRPYTRGIVAMANRGPNTNGSQFFIMLGDNPLPPLYTIFGEVTSGIEVVDAITVGDVMMSVTIE